MTARPSWASRPTPPVEVYNPFDQTGTASWADVSQGIYTLYKKGAYVVNASLGVPGSVLSSDWAKILTSPQLSNRNHDLVLVKAAGNDGITQTANVPWTGGQAPDNLLLVGSIGSDRPDFLVLSNTPGESCILVNGICKEQNKLKYRFLVAPGELILVSDNHGGVTPHDGNLLRRAAGDRRRRPSAGPLAVGCSSMRKRRCRSSCDRPTIWAPPGVDPIYGWGKLDIQASQSPLDFNDLTIYQPIAYSGRPVTTSFLLPTWSPTSLKYSVLNAGQLNLWQQKGAFLVAFETIGSTYPATSRSP